MNFANLNVRWIESPPLLWRVTAGAMALLFFIGCPSHDRQEPEHNVMQKNDVGRRTQVSDDQLMSFVKQIAAGADEKSQAWKDLNTIRRDELVTRLQKIRDAISEDDHRRISVDFVLCLLGHDYENNKGAIVRDLLKEPHQKNPYNDWEAELVHRLIKRGDTRLLSTLFQIVSWADGAMAASLSGYLTYHMRNEPEQFLQELKPQPEGIRQGVYKRLMLDELLTKEDLTSIKRSLESVPKTDPTFDVAHEMLVALRKRHPNENNQ